jgi:plastocyanin
MKTLQKSFIALMMIISTISASATVWNVGNSGFNFSPATITINLGDTVIFNLAGNHNAIEVSQATWNSNGNTSNGGFSMPFGGGTFIPNQVKTYYYVCSPHASSGMKGQIIVNSSTGLPFEPSLTSVLTASPNPANSSTVIRFGKLNNLSNQLNVFDITGKLVWEENNITNGHMLDLSPYRKGVYFVELRTNDFRRTIKLVVQ